MSKVLEYINSLPESRRECISSYKIEKRGDYYVAWFGDERLSALQKTNLGVVKSEFLNTLEDAQDTVIKAYKRQVQKLFPDIVEGWCHDYYKD